MLRYSFSGELACEFVFGANQIMDFVCVILDQLMLYLPS